MGRLISRGYCGLPNSLAYLSIIRDRNQKRILPFWFLTLNSGVLNWFRILRKKFWGSSKPFFLGSHFGGKTRFFLGASLQIPFFRLGLHFTLLRWLGHRPWSCVLRFSPLELWPFLRGTLLGLSFYVSRFFPLVSPLFSWPPPCGGFFCGGPFSPIRWGGLPLSPLAKGGPL